MGGKRSAALPDVPTMKEFGFDVEYYLWVGIFAEEYADSVITVLRSAADKAAHTDKFKTTLGNIGQELDYMDQPEFAKYWAEDAKKVKDAVDAIGRVQG